MTLNRRTLLAATGAGAALGMTNGFFPAAATAADETTTSPNESHVLGYIGTGIRFHTALGSQGLAFGRAKRVCDVDATQAGRALQKIMDVSREKKYPLNTQVHEDYEYELDDKEIDTVIIASPDQWHTKQVIDAMRAGKDVYCEKPLTLTIAEGTLIEKVMEETGRVLQIGTQQRTEFGSRFVTAAAMMREKRVGDLKLVTVCIGGSREAVEMPKAEPPKHLNWDKWQGQCQWKDYRSLADVTDVEGWGAGHPFSRAHRYYRWFYEYSGGKLTDWGAHHVDIAMLAMDKLGDDIGNIMIDPISVEHPVEFVDGMPQSEDRFNCATKFSVMVTFADGTKMHIRDKADDKGFDNGIMFEGTQGRYLVNRGKLVGKPVEMLKQKPLGGDPYEIVYNRPKPKSHMAHFFECVKTRKQPISDVRSHNAMLNVCHAVNIAMRLGRKLTYDPATRSFVGDERANTFVSREARQGYEVA
ncbi:MAG: Gfo/Idh/MocA family oxidoreductase [Planctomycetota bacterium]